MSRNSLCEIKDGASVGNKSRTIVAFDVNLSVAVFAGLGSGYVADLAEVRYNDDVPAFAEGRNLQWVN